MRPVALWLWCSVRPLLTPPCQRCGAWLLAVKHPETATVFAFIGLGAGAVLSILHNVLALALFTSPVFNYSRNCF